MTNSMLISGALDINENYRFQKKVSPFNEPSKL